MAHRGRLNVLAHVLRRPYEEVMAEFREADGTGGAAPAPATSDDGFNGDVRYHLGSAGGLQFPQWQ